MIEVRSWAWCLEVLVDFNREISAVREVLFSMRGVVDVAKMSVRYWVLPSLEQILIAR